jgi:spermidine synthase
LTAREPARIALELFANWVSTATTAFLVEDGEHRALCFTTDGAASSERDVIDNPIALVSEYTRKMMAFLLFRPRPRHVLMIGLGGGPCSSIVVDTCRRRATAIEIDE